MEKRKIRRCRVRISVYFAVLVACMLVLDSTGLAALALLCALLHEVGHLCVLFALNIPVEEISLRIFGTEIVVRENYRVGYGREILVSLAGPAANCLVALLGWAAACAGFYPRQMQLLAVFNLAVALFNLLPIGSLDGGRALECLLCMRLSCAAAQRVCDIVSAVALFPLAGAGVLALSATGYNVTLIVAAVYLLFFLIFKGRLIARPALATGHGAKRARRGGIGKFLRRRV